MNHEKKLTILLTCIEGAEVWDNHRIKHFIEQHWLAFSGSDSLAVRSDVG
ncbi:hypothetical protein LZ023_34765 (plasmid) [Pseudomonas silvicola]|nr:hypothetical protein LZ023_34765 [Pseudomonas silvicola]